MAQRYFTDLGLKQLQKIIDGHEKKKREAGKDAGEAAGMGCDWHDNAPYEDAKERLELAGANIQRLQSELRSAMRVSIVEQQEVVGIGTTIIIELNGIQKKYTIGAANESLTDHGLISYESPIAMPMMGKKKGDTVEVKIKGSIVEIEILDILPPSTKYYELLDLLYGTSKTP